MYYIGKIIPIDADLKEGIINEQYQLNQHFKLFRNNENRHPSFDFCFNIIVRGQKVGYMFYKNNNTYRYSHKDTIQLKIENHILYQSGLAALLTTIERTLKISFHSFYRVDICIDGYNIIKKHNELSASQEFKRKRKVRVHGDYNEDTKLHTSYILGSSKSDKTISIYNKQQEVFIKQKNYITDYWNKNKLISKQKAQIDRIELRLNHKKLRTFIASYKDLETPSFLAAVFKSNAGVLLEFINITNHKDRIHLINWDYFGKLILLKPANTSKEKSPKKYKPVLKVLYQELLSGTSDSKDKKINLCLVDALSIIAVKNDLCDWMVNVVPKWGQEFLKSRKQASQ